MLDPWITDLDVLAAARRAYDRKLQRSQQSHNCNVCDAPFPSGNALHAHLRANPTHAAKLSDVTYVMACDNCDYWQDRWLNRPKTHLVPCTAEVCRKFGAEVRRECGPLYVSAVTVTPYQQIEREYTVPMRDA